MLLRADLARCLFSILKKSMINVTSLDPDAASPTRGSLREEPEAWEPDVWRVTQNCKDCTGFSENPVSSVSTSHSSGSLQA